MQRFALALFSAVPMLYSNAQLFGNAGGCPPIALLNSANGFQPFPPSFGCPFGGYGAIKPFVVPPSGAPFPMNGQNLNGGSFGAPQMGIGGVQNGGSFMGSAGGGSFGQLGGGGLGQTSPLCNCNGPCCMPDPQQANNGMLMGGGGGGDLYNNNNGNANGGNGGGSSGMIDMMGNGGGGGYGKK